MKKYDYQAAVDHMERMVHAVTQQYQHTGQTVVFTVYPTEQDFLLTGGAGAPFDFKQYMDMQHQLAARLTEAGIPNRFVNVSVREWTEWALLNKKDLSNASRQEYIYAKLNKEHPGDYTNVSMRLA
jgi:hypothetical protein